MHCGGCLERIRQAVGRLGGVEGITGELGPKVVRVTYREGTVDPAAVQEAIVAAGFKVERL